MKLTELKSKLIGKKIFGFSSSYAYMFSFQLGTPRLKIKERSKNHMIKEMSQYVFDQEYYKVNVKGEIGFFTDKYWVVKYNKKVICDADYDHYEIEKILSFVLDGHTISDIVISNTKKKYISIIFSNNMVLQTKGNKEDSIVFFPDKKTTFEICPNFGYKHYLNSNGEKTKWKKFD